MVILILLIVNVLFVSLFYFDVFIPFYASFPFIVLSGLILFFYAFKGRIGVIPILTFIVYSLPFIHITTYFTYDFSSPPPEGLWGLTVYEYTVDYTVVNLMSMIATIGALSLAIGSLMFKSGSGYYSFYTTLKLNHNNRAISILKFLILIVVAILLSYISSPFDLLTDAKYSESQAINLTWNFSSAWHISHCLLAWAFADLLLDGNPLRRKKKLFIFSFAIITVVLWFQLMRGDRESLTMLIAMIFMAIYWTRGGFDNNKISKNTFFKKIIFLTIMIALISFIVGIFRSQLDSDSSILELFLMNSDSGEFDFSRMFSGTWTAVLLTPLSIAGDYINNDLLIRYGQTYLDLILSIIPGFLADYIGYIRPIGATSGPSHWMTIGQGGTHAVVVPFIEFRMLGVFFILGIVGALLTIMEKNAVKSMTISKLALLGIVSLTLPHWFWYGEKMIINAIVIFIILNILSRIRIS